MNDFGPLFPVGKKVPEHLQIGRASEIERLERTTSEGHSALMFEERRVGKSSVASVVVARAMACGTGIEIDLRNIADLAELAGALERPLGSLTRDRRVGKVWRSLWKPRRRRLAKLVETFGSVAVDLGVQEARAAVDLARLAGQFEGSVVSARRSPLAVPLARLVAHAQQAGPPAVVFLDEIHRLTGYVDHELAEAEIAAAMRASGKLAFIFAGSEQSPVERLFATGRPLAREGLPFELAPIGDEAWREGLIERFASIEISLSAEMVRGILAVSNGHPQRTMAVCAQLQGLLSFGDSVTRESLTSASRAARKHPSWNG